MKKESNPNANTTQWVFKSVAEDVKQMANNFITMCGTHGRGMNAFVRQELKAIGVNLDFIHQSDPAVSLVSLGQISGVTIAYHRDILTGFHLKMFSIQVPAYKYKLV